MPTLNELTDAEGVIQFVAWSLGLWGLVKAMFWSFPAAEFKHWMQVRESKDIVRFRRMQWELANSAHWNEKAARGDQMAAKVPLTDAEREERLTRMRRLHQDTRLHRALMWFADCVFCQSFWLGLVALIVTGPIEMALPSALAYAATVATLNAKLTRPAVKSRTKEPGPCPGGDC